MAPVGELSRAPASAVPAGGSSTVAAGLAPRRGRGGRNQRAAWLFLAPSLAILGVFVLWPILVSFWYSLHDWTVGAASQPWVGAGNYVKLVHDPQFRKALVNTLEITVASVVLLVVVGLALALALLSEGLLSRIVRSAFFFSFIVSLTTVGLVWRFLLDPDIGLVGGVTKALGLGAESWLQSTRLALPAVVFVNVWKNAGFVMIVLLAGLKAIPPQLYEAAALDGARRWQLLRHITLPSLRPTLLFVTFILTIQSLQIFDLVYVMTGGGPLFSTDTLVTKLYRDGFVNFETGYAAATSWVLFAIIVVVSALQLRLFRYNDVD